MAIRHESGRKFRVIVVNPTDRAIRVGELASALGFDQFVFKIRIRGEIATLRRRHDLAFTADTLSPTAVASGSFHEFEINFGDGTWAIDDRTKLPWLAIKAEYQPDGCALVDERTKKDVFDKKMEGQWLELAAADDR